jgi:hypothetical protein
LGLLSAMREQLNATAPPCKGARRAHIKKVE